MPASAQEKAAVRPGFSQEALRGQKILLFRPSVWVGSQSTAGLPEPNADWTASARALLEADLAKRQADFDDELIAEPELAAEDARLLAEHRALFTSVANSVMVYQFFAGNRLPTRKRHPFVWTLGDGMRSLAEATGARYGLFVRVDDQYGSLGRKMFQLLVASVGVGIRSGAHIGYAGLVDLRSGDLVWLYADGEMGGDVRTEDGVHKRVDQLLKGFPAFKPQAVSKP
jgi:hypothetical protein